MDAQPQAQSSTNTTSSQLSGYHIVNMNLLGEMFKQLLCPNCRTPSIDLQQGRPQDLGGGGPRNFFFRFGNLHVAKRHAAHGEAMRIARGVRGHAPPRNFFKTVQFGAF